VVAQTPAAAEYRILRGLLAVRCGLHQWIVLALARLGDPTDWLAPRSSVPANRTWLQSDPPYGLARHFSRRKTAGAASQSCRLGDRAASQPYKHGGFVHWSIGRTRDRDRRSSWPALLTRNPANGSAALVEDEHGAGRQTDEPVGGAADNPFIKLRLAHETDDQQIGLELRGQPMTASVM
jgi:hypothetical protein